MDAVKLQQYVIEPTLKSLNMYSAAAVKLLMGTAAQESQCDPFCRRETGLGIYQISAHTIELGASYSLRFDASVFSSNAPPIVFTPNLTLVGPGQNNGDFNDDTSATSSRSFTDTPSWTNLGTGGQPLEATRTNLALDSTRNAVVSDKGNKIFAVDTDVISISVSIFLEFSVLLSML